MGYHAGTGHRAGDEGQHRDRGLERRSETHRRMDRVQLEPAAGAGGQSEDGGQTWAAAQRLSNGDAGMPRLAAYSDGTRVTAVWIDGGTAVARTWNAGTNTWSAADDLSSAGEDAHNLNVAMSGDGQTITATWSDFNYTNPLRVATSENGGTTWDSPVSISTGSLRTGPGETHIAADGTRIVTVWVEGDDGTTWPAMWPLRSAPTAATPGRPRKHCPSGGRTGRATGGQRRRSATRSFLAVAGRTRKRWRPHREIHRRRCHVAGVGVRNPGDGQRPGPPAAASADLQRRTIVWNEEKSPGRCSTRWSPAIAGTPGRPRSRSAPPREPSTSRTR